jgi:signal transduction histidine kinase
LNRPVKQIVLQFFGFWQFAPSASQLKIAPRIELLVNVAKHAGVHRARVRIRRKGEHIIIRVEYQGVGFDSKVIYDPKKPHGLGLFSIRERLDYLGGSMEIHSSIGKKTAIALTRPVVMEKKRAIESRP